jgi:hypothetical protein
MTDEELWERLQQAIEDGRRAKALRRLAEHYATSLAEIQDELVSIGADR